MLMDGQVLDRNVVLDGKQFSTIPIDRVDKAIEGVTAFEKNFSSAAGDADWVPVFDPSDPKWNVPTIGCYGFAANYRKPSYFVQPGLAFSNSFGQANFISQRDKLVQFRENGEQVAQHVAVGVSRHDLYEYLGKRKINMNSILSKKAWPIALFMKEHSQQSPSGAYHDFHFTALRRVPAETGLKYAWVEKPGWPNPKIMGSGEDMFKQVAANTDGKWRFGGFFAAYQH